MHTAKAAFDLAVPPGMTRCAVTVQEAEPAVSMRATMMMAAAVARASVVGVALEELAELRPVGCLEPCRAQTLWSR